MKKIYYMLIAVLLTTGIFTANAFVSVAQENVQAVWIATVFNLDFPSTKNDVVSQKNEYIEKLDKLKDVGINTVIVQVRPKADALYRSDINPWSDVLTGEQGKDPGYDPMSFMIEEAHKRGMSFHAWLNPYRITTSGTDTSVLCETHPARLNPDWTMSYNDALYYNPEKEGVKNHIVSTVEEIVKKYDVDAVVFDDYFYPSNYPLPDGEGKDGEVANSRRQHINDMVERVNKVIKNTKSNVMFGISPSGIWKNKISDPTGSDTSGNESYYSVYADTRTWIKNGWIDYVSPQIYWETGHKAADYETLVKWWSNEVNGTNVKLYISQGIYREVVAKQIDTQLKINQNYSQVSGSCYYKLKNLLADTAGCKTKIASLNSADTLAAQDNDIYALYLSDSSLKSSPRSGTVTAGVLNVRSGAGTQHAVVSKIDGGTKVTILEENAGWYNVELENGQIGWVIEDYLNAN